MKIIELHIENVRGIKSLEIEPGGQNFVIWGPNGSGKSAVVDAIDFLLTGRISRLTGPGTGGITIGKHGSHIDASPKEASVRAIIKIPSHPDPIEISRTMNRAGQLVCADDTFRHLEPVIELAKRKQHVLSRRDILRFVTAESSSRAESFRTLLDLADVEGDPEIAYCVQG